jgi:hypothetical protein
VVVVNYDNNFMIYYGVYQFLCYLTREKNNTCVTISYTTRKKVIRGVQNLGFRGVLLYATDITPLIQSYPWRTACTPRLQTHPWRTGLYATGTNPTYGVQCVRHRYKHPLASIDTIVASYNIFLFCIFIFHFFFCVFPNILKSFMSKCVLHRLARAMQAAPPAGPPASR